MIVGTTLDINIISNTFSFNISLSLSLSRSQSFVVPAGDELIVEATQGLREWKKKLRELYIVSY